MKTAVITDSVSYLSPEMQSHPDIYVIPIPISFPDGREFKDSSALEDLKSFLDQIEKDDKLPSTAQPAPGHYLTLVKEIIAKGYDEVFAVHLSSGISGMFASVSAYIQEFKDDINIYMIDSKGATVQIEILIRQILYLKNDCQINGAEVAEKVQWMADQSEIYLMVENMENLAKGGRVNKSIARIGGALKVRPILHFDEIGEITLFETVRTTKKVYKRWLELAKEAVSKYSDDVVIALAHADNEEAVEDLKEKIKKEIPEYKGEVQVGLLGPVVSIYTGRKALGIGFIPLKK